MMVGSTLFSPLPLLFLFYLLGTGPRGAAGAAGPVVLLFYGQWAAAVSVN